MRINHFYKTMKNFIFLLLSILDGIIVNGQITPIYTKFQSGAIPDSILIYSNTTETDSLLQSKYVYSYSGNIKSQSIYLWDSVTKEWYNSNKHVDSLDTDKNIVLEVNYRSENNVWTLYTKTEFIYSKGQKTSISSFNWDVFEEKWEKGRKYEYDYLQDGKITQLRYFNGYSIDSEWEISSKTDYLYNQEGQLIYEYDSSTYGSDLFTPVYKTEHTYNMGKKEASITYRWKENCWQNYMKQDYNYNSKDSLICIIKYKYNNSDSLWDNNYRHQYDYDDAGNLVIEDESTWDTALSQWLIYTIYEWDYNQSNDLECYLSRFYDLKLKTWSGSKHVYTYNFYKNIVYSLDYIWNNDLYDFKFSTKSFYYYSGDFVDINDVKTIVHPVIKLYPNPCGNTLSVCTTGFEPTVEYLKCQIFDLAGREVLPLWNIPYSERFDIDVSELFGGYYLLKVQTGKDFQVIKFLKK